MYSVTDYCSLQIREGVSLEDARTIFDDIEDYNGCEDMFHINQYGSESHEVEIILSDGGWKLIGYWYDETLDMLEELAKVLEGSWALTYETNEYAAVINFKSGKVSIDIGSMEWSTYPIEHYRKHRVRG